MGRVMLKCEWVLKRNCSLAPRQLIVAYLVLCAMSLSVALFFTAHGAWYVLGFSFLEMSAVGLAFVQYARHATDCERIALIDDCLQVELVQSERSQVLKLNARRTRIALPAARQGLIGLEADGLRIEVGRFLPELRRREFARELQLALAGGT